MMAHISGIIYKKLKRRNAVGLVEPDSDIIHADSRLKGAELLDVLIHEGTHILQPYLTEEAVDHIGVELSKMLWADGWRRMDLEDLQKPKEETENTEG
jgi:hypothetical protein